MKKDKQVALLLSSLGGGGAEGVCVNIANGLAERGYDVDLIVLNMVDASYKLRVSTRVNIVSLDVGRIRFAFFPLIKILKKIGVNKVIVFNYELTVLVNLLRLFLRFECVVFSRNINTMSVRFAEMGGSSFWVRRFLNPFLYRFYFKSDFIINQCRAMEQDLLELCPELIGRTCVIYNPVAKHIEEYVADNDVSAIDKEDYFLCVGRLEAQKAFHYAIHAFHDVLKDYPYVRMKIIGKGSLERDLKKLAADLGVEGSVDFEGFKENVIPYYIKARATVLTSLYEGFPNVLLESIALGTPVLAFDCPSGPKEIVVDGVNGWLINYQDVDGLARSMRKVLSEGRGGSVDELRSTLKGLTIDDVLDNYEELLAR